MRSIQSATIGFVVNAHRQPEDMEDVSLHVNGAMIRVRAGSSVAAAVMQADAACRISVSGEPRAPLCGMGICMECRATVDGIPHVRTCQTIARNGMQVSTG